MARRQSWAEHAPAGSPARRGEQRKLLIELELDDAVFGADAAGRSRRGRNSPSSGSLPPSLVDVPYERYPHGGRAVDRPRSASSVGVGQMGYAHRDAMAATSPSGSDQARKLSSPFKLKQEVLSTRAEGYAEDYSPAARRKTKGGRVSRQSSRTTASFSLIQDGIRQNIQLRDETIQRLRDELVVGLDSSQRPRGSSAMAIPARLISAMNRLRGLTLAVVEMVVHLQRQCVQEKNLLTPDDADQVNEALECDFFPYLLQISSTDMEFVSCSPQLQRFFDAQSVSLSRNPFLEGLTLESSELLLCSCNYVSSSSASALFSSSTKPSGASMFQLLIHKLEAFAVQTERFLPGWQPLPCNRVATALLHLIELETRCNAARMMPRYLQPPLSQARSTPAQQRQGSNVGPSNAINDNRSAHRNWMSYVEEEMYVPPEPVAVHDPWISSTSQAWDPYTAEMRSMLPRVPFAAQQTTAVVEDNAPRLSDPKPTTAPSFEPPELATAAAKASNSSSVRASKKKGGREIASTVSELPPAEPKVQVHLASIQRSDSAAKMNVVQETSKLQPDQRSFEGAKDSVDVRSDPVHSTRPILEPIENSHTIHAQTAKIGMVGSSFALEELEEPRTSSSKSPLQLEALALQTSRSEPLALSPTPQPAATDEGVTAALAPLTMVPSDENGSDEEYSPSQMMKQLALAMDMLPRFDLSELPLNLSELDESGPSVDEPNVIAGFDDSSSPSAEQHNLEEQDEIRSPESTEPHDTDTVSIYNSGTIEAANIITSASVDNAPPDIEDVSVFCPPKQADPSAMSNVSNNVNDNSAQPPALSSTTDGNGFGLGKIFDLCRDVQVAALDLRHRFSEYEVDLNDQTELPMTFSGLRDTRSKTVGNDDAPRYLERELKVLRRYFASWRENSTERRRIKQKLQSSAAQRTIHRFGVFYIEERNRRQAHKRHEQQTASARVLQRSWVNHSDKMSKLRLQHEFVLLHTCFHRMRFFAAVSIRKRRREAAKETILRCWRRMQVRLRRVRKQQERLRQQRERKDQAIRTIKQCLREWILRRRLAVAQRQTRQTMFKENLKWTKAKRDHEKILSLEKKRRDELSSKLTSNLAELEQKWQQTDAERIKLAAHNEKVLKQHQRAVERKQRELAGQKIQAFIKACHLRRRLVEAEKRHHDTNQQITELDAKNRQISDESRRSKAKMRLRHRLLERRLESAERDKTSTNEHYKQQLESRMVSEKLLEKEIARRTINTFVDRQLAVSKAKQEAERQAVSQSLLRAEKAETEMMAAQDLSERIQQAKCRELLLEERLAKVHSDSLTELAHRDKLLEEKEGEAQRAAELLHFNRVEASKTRLNAWLTGQVRISRLKREADAALAAATQEVETGKRHQQEMRRNSAREVAALKIGSFVVNQFDLSRARKSDEDDRRRREEQYAREMVSEQRVRAYIVQIVVEVKLKSEQEAAAGIATAVRRLQELSVSISHRNEKLKKLKAITQARRIQVWWQSVNRRRLLDREQRRRREQRVETVKLRECARRIQANWRRHNIRRQQRDRKTMNRKLSHIETVLRRECARHIQTEWRRHKLRRQREGEELERRILRVEGVRHRECARHIQTEWRRYNAGRRRTNEELVRKVSRVEAVMQRECARQIQTQWRRHYAKRQQALEEEWGRKRSRVEQVKQRECARHIQNEWRRHHRDQQRAAEEFDQKVRRTEAVKRRECARHIQSKWRTHHSEQQQAINEELDRKSRRVEAVKWRECARRIQSEWRRHQHRASAEMDRKVSRIEGVKRRECARHIQKEWRRHQYLRKQQEQDELDRKARRVEAVKYRESARHIQTQWRNHMERRDQQREMHERRMQRAQAIQQRSRARQIQCGWRQFHSKRQREAEALEREISRIETVRQDECTKQIQKEWRRWRHQQRDQEERRALVSNRLGSIRLNQMARIIQRYWKCWQRAKRALYVNGRLEAIRSNCYARRIQRCWHQWRDTRVAMQLVERIAAIRCSCCARRIQRNWRRYQIAQAARRFDEHLADLRSNASARIVQRCWIDWRQLKLQQMEEERKAAAREASARKIQAQFIRWFIMRKRSEQTRVEDEAAVRIQRRYRGWIAGKQRRANESRNRVAALRHRVSSRRIVRAWRRFRHIQQFTAATQIGSVWRGRCARQAYQLTVQAHRARDSRLNEIKLSVLAVKVQRCWQEWRACVRHTRRAEVRARELEMIQQEKRQARQRQAVKEQAPVTITQTRFRSLSSREGKKNKEKLRQLEQAKAEEEVELKQAFMQLQQEKRERDLEARRVLIDPFVRQWNRCELLHILTTSISTVMLKDEAARIIQRSFRQLRRRLELWLLAKPSLQANKSGVNLASLDNEDVTTAPEFRFYFQHTKAWMEWLNPTISYTVGDDKCSVQILRLRFDAEMTRKLLRMCDFDLHSREEIQNAIDTIAADALPIFQSSTCQQSHRNPDHLLRYLDVEELELPHFCALTRSMGKIRSMHRRRQHSAPTSPTSSSVGFGSRKSSCQIKGQAMTVFEAVENASVDDAVYLQQLGADLGALESKTQRNALHLLTFSTENYRFRLEMLEFLLLDSSVDVNAKDCNGDTPLLLYAAHGHIEFMSKLIARGANLYITNTKGQNVLHRACEEDQVEVCAFLCRHMNSSQEAADGESHAATEGDQHCRATLHAPDRSGLCPLHIAASKGLVESARQLFDNSGSQAATQWNRDLLMQRDGHGRTALHVTVLARDAAMLGMLLAYTDTSVINAGDDLRRSAMHLAIDAAFHSATNALTLLTALIEHGADLNCADERGDTPLHWAALAGHPALVRFLVVRGADPTAVNSDWETPAQIAADNGHLACVKAMVAPSHRGSDVDDDIAGELADRIFIEAAINLAHQQASAQSYHIPSSRPVVVAARAEYWEELHQEVQLVDESGHFSSEDEDEDESDTAKMFDI